MAKYTIQIPDGRTLDIEGDTMPTEAELDQIISALPPDHRVPAAATMPIPNQPQLEAVRQQRPDIGTQFADMASKVSQSPIPDSGAMGATGLLGVGALAQKFESGIQRAAESKNPLNIPNAFVQGLKGEGGYAEFGDTWRRLGVNETLASTLGLIESGGLDPMQLIAPLGRGARMAFEKAVTGTKQSTGRALAKVVEATHGIPPEAAAAALTDKFSGLSPKYFKSQGVKNLANNISDEVSKSIVEPATTKYTNTLKSMRSIEATTDDLFSLRESAASLLSEVDSAKQRRPIIQYVKKLDKKLASENPKLPTLADIMGEAKDLRGSYGTKMKPANVGRKKLGNTLMAAMEDINPDLKTANFEYRIAKEAEDTLAHLVGRPDKGFALKPGKSSNILNVLTPLSKPQQAAPELLAKYQALGKDPSGLVNLLNEAQRFSYAKYYNKIIPKTQPAVLTGLVLSSVGGLMGGLKGAGAALIPSLIAGSPRASGLILRNLLSSPRTPGVLGNLIRGGVIDPSLQRALTGREQSLNVPELIGGQTQ